MVNLFIHGLVFNGIITLIMHGLKKLLKAFGNCMQNFCERRNVIHANATL